MNEPFVCCYENCNKRFSVLNNYVKHLRTCDRFQERQEHAPTQTKVWTKKHQKNEPIAKDGSNRKQKIGNPHSKQDRGFNRNNENNSSKRLTDSECAGKDSDRLGIEKSKNNFVSLLDETYATAKGSRSIAQRPSPTKEDPLQALQVSDSARKENAMHLSYIKNFNRTISINERGWPEAQYSETTRSAGSKFANYNQYVYTASEASLIENEHYKIPSRSNAADKNKFKQCSNVNEKSAAIEKPSLNIVNSQIWKNRNVDVQGRADTDVPSISEMLNTGPNEELITTHPHLNSRERAIAVHKLVHFRKAELDQKKLIAVKKGRTSVVRVADSAKITNEDHKLDVIPRTPVEPCTLTTSENSNLGFKPLPAGEAPGLTNSVECKRGGCGMLFLDKGELLKHENFHCRKQHMMDQCETSFFVGFKSLGQMNQDYVQNYTKHMLTFEESPNDNTTNQILPHPSMHGTNTHTTGAISSIYNDAKVQSLPSSTIEYINQEVSQDDSDFQSPTKKVSGKRRSEKLFHQPPSSHRTTDQPTSKTTNKLRPLPNQCTKFSALLVKKGLADISSDGKIVHKVSKKDMHFPIYCPECNACIRSQKKWEAHIQQHESYQGVTCNLCSTEDDKFGYRYDSQAKLKSHFAKCHSTTSKGAVSPKADQASKVKAAEPGGKKRKTSPNVQKLCGPKSSACAKIKKVMPKKSKKKKGFPLLCPECNACILTVKDWDIHLQSHKDYKCDLKIFTCKLCMPGDAKFSCQYDSHVDIVEHIKHCHSTMLKIDSAINVEHALDIVGLNANHQSKRKFPFAAEHEFYGPSKKQILNDTDMTHDPSQTKHDFTRMCPECGTSLFTQGHMSSHFEHHRQRQGVKCAECSPKDLEFGFRYSSKVEHHRHLKRCHMVSSPEALLTNAESPHANKGIEAAELIVPKPSAVMDQLHNANPNDYMNMEIFKKDIYYYTRVPWLSTSSPWQGNWISKKEIDIRCSKCQKPEKSHSKSMEHLNTDHQSNLSLQSITFKNLEAYHFWLKRTIYQPDGTTTFELRARKLTATGIVEEFACIGHTVSTHGSRNKYKAFKYTCNAIFCITVLRAGAVFVSFQLHHSNHQPVASKAPIEPLNHVVPSTHNIIKQVMRATCSFPKADPKSGKSYALPNPYNSIFAFCKFGTNEQYSNAIARIRNTPHKYAEKSKYMLHFPTSCETWRTTRSTQNSSDHRTL